jgi:hypothetical protein
MNNPSQWKDAIFELIDYRRKLEKITDIDAEVFDMAVYAMKKQEPKKPRKLLDQFGIVYNYYCPVCGMYFGTRGKRNGFIFNRPPYCNCGQALDWTEE